MIRIAAVGDLHYDRHSQGRVSKYLMNLKGQAELLLIAGDLTQIGNVEEGKVLAADLAQSPVPVVTVFGNHDYHSDQQLPIRRALEDARVIVLEREVVQLNVAGVTVGIVGLKGFGGGFVGACITDFGEPETKAYIRTTKLNADFLREALCALKCDYKVVLLHYSPVSDTLLGEKREIYPFLGSYLLGEAIDDGEADLVLHGHAHAGVEKGRTPGGVPVRNVAQHVIRHVFNIYTLNKEGLVSHSDITPHLPSSL